MRPIHNKAFTLVEVMLATMIGSFVTLVAMGALVTVSRSVEDVQQFSQQRCDSRAVMRLIRRDLRNLYRGVNVQEAKFVGRDEESNEGGYASLTFYSLWQGQVRQGQAEGDVVEIEYFVRQTESGTALMRRIWPNPDPQREEGGGLLTVLSDKLLLFEVRYHDGQEWLPQWSEEKQQLPKLVEVSIALGDSEDKTPQVESFLMAYSRAQGSQALGSSEPSGDRDEQEEGES